MIRVQNLVKTFKLYQKAPGLKGSIKGLFSRQHQTKHALKNISLSVQAGEILGLVGANGAGKTTLIKILTGIIHPTSGSAEVLGYRPWDRSDDFRRQIALIMGQKAQLWWDLPAADCFLLLREIYQIPRDRYHDTLQFLAEKLQVKEQLNVQIRRLSLGERMKMELIAALLHQPRVVFLDEPTIGLDLSAQRAIREFLLQYRERHEPAMILTSHYMEDIEKLCKRIVIIRDGELVYDGPLDSISREYGAHKLITARLSPDADLTLIGGIFPSTLGLRVDAEKDAYTSSKSGPDSISFKVPRERVPEAASEILKRYPVADLTIEDEGIATLIESIIRKPKP